MKKIIISLVIILLAFSLVACQNDNQDGLGIDIENPSESAKKESYTVNIDGSTVKERYPVPNGYSRVKLEEKSFGEFLRSQKLKAYGEKVIYYNGREKANKGIYDSVFDVDIGDRDLHQCADAIILLRAEYLYANELYDEITFNFVSGFTAEYKKWMEGYRIKVEGNDVSYYKAADPANTYESFRKYMDMVMAYASTLSLEKELESILSSVDGAGKVQVMITLKNTSTKEVLMEEPYSESNVTEHDGDGGSRDTNEKSQDYHVIYKESSDGTMIPFVVSEISPQVEGVAVVAEGGDSAVVKEKITGIIKALFGIEINKIAVGKMK